MKEVLIDILGSQTLGEELPEEIRLTTVGKIGEKNGKIYLIYEEAEGEYDTPVTTTLKIQGEESLVMQRSGGSQTRLTVTRGQRELCRYETPYGDLMIGVYGENMENRLTESGGSLSLSYTIDANMAMLSRNTLKITVK